MEIAQPVVSLHAFRRRPFASLSDSLGHKKESIHARKRQRFTPKCEPLNRAAFFRRAKTFSLLNWGTKPVELSPLECARSGWVCMGRDIMSCESCTAFLCVKLSNRIGSELKNLIRHFTSQLTDGHEQGCAWLGNPCPPTFVKLHEHPVVLRTEFLDRFKTWVGRIECLETGVYTHPVLHPPVRELLKKRWREHEDASNMSPSDIILLSACGWQLKELDSRDYLSSTWMIACNYCNRQVNLTSFDLDDTNSPSSTKTASPEPQPESDPRSQEHEQADNFPPQGYLFPTEELREPFAGPDNNEIVDDGMFGWTLHRGYHTPPSKMKTIRSKRSRGMVDVEDSRAAKRLKSWCDRLPPRWPGTYRKRSRDSPPPSVKALEDRPGSKKPRMELNMKAKSESSSRALKRKFSQNISPETDETRIKRHRLNTFDLLKAHSYFCPYVVLKRDGPGWMRVLRVLPRDALYYTMGH